MNTEVANVRDCDIAGSEFEYQKLKRIENKL